MSNFGWLPAKRRTHAIHRAEEVHHDRHRSALRILEQKCRTAIEKHPLGYFRHLEFRVDLYPDPLELSPAFEMTEEFLQACK